MTYNAIIVEDNPVDAEVLRDYLHKYFPEITIAGSTDSVTEIKKLLLQHSPQIAFMDIELANGKSIEVLDSFNTENIQLIFITSHHVFAIDAIRANAVDYIVKPVDAVLLKKAVMKAFQRIEQSQVAKLTANGSTYKISIPTAEGLTFIDVESLVRLEADGNYTKIVLIDSKVHLVTRTLLHFESRLPANLFMRVHDSCIVNRKFITEFIKGKSGSIKMKDSFVCNISKGKKEDFLQWMQGNAG